MVEESKSHLSAEEHHIGSPRKLLLSQDDPTGMATPELSMFNSQQLTRSQRAMLTHQLPSC